MSRAIADFAMIADGDRILVAVSGGKDSYTMLHLLRALQRKAPVRFELRVVNVDQGHPGYPGHVLREYMAREGYDFTMIEEDTYSIVTEKIPAGKTYCSLCSRLRRGILYRVATELGCNKIALGHHRDDVLQTLLLNLLFAGQLAAMPPKLFADDGDARGHPPARLLRGGGHPRLRRARAVPDSSRATCAARRSNLQRKAVGELLDGLERDRPGSKASMLAALQNVGRATSWTNVSGGALGIGAAGDEEETREYARPIDAA